jgi:hypothetical protein
LSLSCDRPIQSTSPHPTSTRSILILSTHLRLGLPSGLLSSGFPANNLYALLFLPHSCYMPRSIFMDPQFIILLLVTCYDKHTDSESCYPLTYRAAVQYPAVSTAGYWIFDYLQNRGGLPSVLPPLLLYLLHLTP